MTRKTYFQLFVVFLFLFVGAAAHAFTDTLWVRAYGGADNDWGREIRKAEDGNYVFSGSYYIDAIAENQMTLTKIDPDGNLLWFRHFGGGLEESGFHHEVCSDGGFILGGYTYSMGAGGRDIYFVKTDPDGNLEWQQAYGYPGEETCQVVYEADAGGYWIYGQTTSIGAGGQDYWLIRTDAAGNIIWEQTYGGASNDGASDGCPTPDGGFIMIGEATSFGAGGYDYLVYKVNAGGDVEWWNTYGSTGTDYGRRVLLHPDGGYLFLGYSNSYGIGNYGVYLVKTDASGNEEWDFHFDTAENLTAQDLAFAPDGRIIIAGSRHWNGSEHIVMLLRINDGGGGIPQECYMDLGAGDEKSYDITMLNNGLFLVSGYTSSLVPGNIQACIMKWDLYFEPLVDYIQVDGTITGAYGPMDDDGNLAGMSHNATDEFDPGLDEYEPPRMPGTYFSIYFPHPEWGAPLGDDFAVDVIEHQDVSQKTFRFHVDTDQTGNPVDLNFTMGSAYVVGRGAYIHDTVADVYFDLWDGVPYSYTQNELSRPFDLFYCDVSNPDLTIDTPSEGEEIDASGDYLFSWTVVDESPVKEVLIEASYNGGTDYSTLATLNGDPGIYNWTPPYHFYTDCRLRITATEWARHSDQEILTFSLDDPAGPTTTFTYPTSTDTLYGGLEYDLTWLYTLIPGSDVLLATLSYSLDDGSTWTEITDALTNEETYHWTCPNGLFSEEARFKIYATDLGDNSNEGISDPFTIYPIDAENDFIEGWHLFGLPLESDDPTTEATIGDDIMAGTYAVMAYTTNGYTFPDEIHLGPGYWLALDGTGTVTIDVIGSAMGDSLVTELPTGWSLLGCPIPGTLGLNRMRFTDGAEWKTFTEAGASGWIVPTFYSWDPVAESYDPSPTEFEAWHGYWLLALVADIDFVTYAEPPAAPPLAEEPEVPGEVELDEVNDWLVNIQLQQGTRTDLYAGFGVLEEATDGFDIELDRPCAPFPPSGRYVRTEIDRQAWNVPGARWFMTDIRTPLDEGESKVWPFDVRASAEGEVQVSFEGVVGQLPENYEITAVIDGSSYDLRLVDQVEFDHPGGDVAVDMEITVLSPYTGVAPDPPAVPDRFSVTAYPNPFNQRVTVHLELPEAAATRIQLYNVLGERVRMVQQGRLPAGYHEFTINGDGLAGGLYLLSTEAGNHRRTTKIVYLK